MLTEEQRAIRRTGITATDVGKIVGQSPYGCALDVQMDKRGEGRPFVDHDRVKWGNLLELPIREDYAERHGVSSIEGTTIRHPDEKWALATPDAMIYPVGVIGSLPIRGHEIKTHTNWLSHLYGEPGSDEVPKWELLQCVWNTWVASHYYGVQLERWDLTVFLDGLPVDYTIWRDVDLEAAVIDACREFWEVHCVGGAPVPPDGSEHYSEILKARWPAHNPDAIVDATPDQMALVQELQAAREAKKAQEAEEARLVQEIKLLIGDGEALRWPDGKKSQKITWKRSKDSEVQDLSGLARAYRGEAELASGLARAYRNELERAYHLSGGTLDLEIEALDELERTHPLRDLDELLAAHTSTKPGSRRFTVPRTWGSK